MLTFAVTNSLAGVSGKISGEVIDADSGDPVVGATVRVVGTEQVTMTDVDGEYFVINLPVGKHDVSVSSVGYETLIKKEVRVLVDLTTPVDFELDRTTIELGQEVVVYAQDPVIQRDLTASRVIFRRRKKKGRKRFKRRRLLLT